MAGPNVDLATAQASGFIPQFWAQKALDVLRANIVLAKLVTKDTDYAPGWQGETLTIPYPGTFTAQAKSPDTQATIQTPVGGTSVALTLSNHQYVDFLVEDVARAQANSDLLMRYVQPAAIALANAVENSLWALYSSFTTSIGTSGTAVAASLIRTAKQTHDTALVPPQDRSLVISPKDVIGILGDSNLQTYFAFAQQGQQAISEGSIGKLYGYDVYESQLVPVVTGTPNSTKNLAFTPDAMMLATRPFRDPPAGSGVAVSTVQDAESGLTLRVLSQYAMGDRGVRVGFDMLWGVVKLRDAAGMVVLS